ncbi:MAG: hypothetical protein IIU06_05285 [Erysipelotrichales bacterium]|nr:hypothetical protein [Erysipelotrichales bacterium]
MENAKKYPILGSFAAKTAAVILLCVFGIGILFGGLGVLYSINYEMYNVPADATYYDTAQCRNTVYQSAKNIALNYAQGNTEIASYEYREENSNIVYRLYTMDEKTEETLVSENYKASGTGYDAEYYVTADYAGNTDPSSAYDSPEMRISSITQDKTEAFAFPAAETAVRYHVVLGVVKPLKAYDTVWREAQIYEYAHTYESFMVPVLVISALLFIADLIFLLCSAGHRKGKETVELNWFDRIPLDVLSVVLVTLIILFAIFILDVVEPWIPWAYFNGGIAFAITVVGTVACLIVEGLMILALIMTLATRIKAGGWWKNTWLWLFGEAALRFFEAIPSVWQVTLAAIVYLGLTVWFLSERASLPLLVMNCVAAVIAVIYAFFYKRISGATERMAKGDLDLNVDTQYLVGPVKKQAENLNSIRDGMKTAVESRMKSERLKTELITNVSHDIRTPLTSIINYVDLLQKEPGEEERNKYMERLSRNANRLKKLTEDLIEASKASTGNIPVHAENLDLREIIEQALAEYEERFEAKNLEPIINMDQGVKVYADGRLLWRVLSNLFSNISKYAHDDTRIYIDVKAQGNAPVNVCIKNISHDPLNIDADELMERFVRADSSRHTDGSGLGLNIAKSLMELQGGALNLTIDGDLFRADIGIPAEKPEPVS